MMVIIFNSMSIIYFFTTQVVIDVMSFGVVAIFKEQERESAGVLNLTALDTLAISIIQSLILGCIYMWLRFDKSNKLYEELRETTDMMVYHLRRNQKSNLP